MACRKLEASLLPLLLLDVGCCPLSLDDDWSWVLLLILLSVLSLSSSQLLFVITSVACFKTSLAPLEASMHFFFLITFSSLGCITTSPSGKNPMVLMDRAELPTFPGCRVSIKTNRVWISTLTFQEEAEFLAMVVVSSIAFWIHSGFETTARNGAWDFLTEVAILLVERR